jgi:hypothetical protein
MIVIFGESRWDWKPFRFPFCCLSATHRVGPLFPKKQTVKIAGWSDRYGRQSQFSVVAGTGCEPIIDWQVSRRNRPPTAPETDSEPVSAREESLASSRPLTDRGCVGISEPQQRSPFVIILLRSAWVGVLEKP